MINNLFGYLDIQSITINSLTGKKYFRNYQSYYLMKHEYHVVLTDDESYCGLLCKVKEKKRYFDI